MKTDIDPKQLRSFGLIVGGIFALIGIWPMVWRGSDPRWWAIVSATLLIAPAMTVPRILAPVHRAWMFVGHILGWVNTRIILAIGFFGLVTPVGFFMRLAGKDPMRRRYERAVPSYRVAKPSRTGSHMQQQF
jgi:Saxitoxin biosynthesis operon protein SxtJ